MKQKLIHIVSNACFFVTHAFGNQQGDMLKAELNQLQEKGVAIMRDERDSHSGFLRVPLIDGI